MFHRTSSNPFEEESLPKAYYFPSKERNISSSQKKTCLSPNKDNQKQTSKADVKFLRESNKLEIPTREDGTVQHEVSSGSQFNESWPSTDKNVSSLSQNTLSSSSTPGEKQTERLASRKISDENLHDDRSSHPTLSKYIERFRRGAPTSREDRSITSSGKDFWWLSPPSNTSTPKDTSDSSTSKYTSENSSNTKRNPTLTSSPVQKHGFKRNQFSRPVREAVAAKDSSTTDLLARTNELLEKSENTLSEISSESLPKPPSSWMVEKQRRLNDAATQAVTKPRPAPENDILYQWRLARRLERAQEEAKSSEGKHFGSIASHRSATLTRYNTYLPEQDQPRHHTDNHDGENAFKHSENAFFKNITKIPDRTVHGDKVKENENGVYSHTPERACFEGGEKIGYGQNITGNNEMVPIESRVPAVCFIGEEKLPSAHVHMMCDIVPCSKQLRQKRVGETTQRASGICGNAHTEFDSAEIQCRDDSQERSSIRVGDLPEGPSILGTTNAPCHSELTETKKERKNYGAANNNNLHDQREIIPDARQPLVVHSETAESNTVRQTTSEKVNPNTDTENSAVSKERVKNQHRDKLTRTIEGNENKPISNRTTKSNNLTNLDDTSPSLVSRDPRGTDRDGNEDQLADVQNREVIGAVIGQVISERLFSSVSSSRRSSLSNGSVLTECEGVDDKETKMVATSEECEKHVQEPTTITPNEILFPDDDILIRLRRQAEFYKEHLRNIDRILGHLTDKCQPTYTDKMSKMA